ncbi:hypothetical protein GH714_044122 [Hevea brasiliensis]|uniref:Uncharacterized protein n=1 Tax=Hevea brasiliensis TaxID=3981 RepID=A0A6A6K1C5_HEVBR|nr:hypothetical protein GH714_044122 [Hevea brasiliensis]
MKKLRAEVKDKGLPDSEHRRRESNLRGKYSGLSSKDGRARKQRKFGHQTPKELIAKLKGREQLCGKIAKYENDAVEQLAVSLDDRFEELRNDVALGAVISRSFEQVEKVATALAAGNGGVITEAMLMWSYCFVCESLMDVFSMLKKVIRAKAIKGLAESIGRANGEDANFGAEILIGPVITELMKDGAIDSIGRGYWIRDASKIASCKMNIKFSQVVDGVGMNNQRDGNDR